MSFRIGFGVDFHQLVENRDLWLGGVKIPHDKGAKGHSDADVLLHAICDAMLGAAALGEGSDLGTLAESLGSASTGTDGLVSMVMGFVYPSLKPMLEASIRKIVVTVAWKEGVRERTLVVTQFVTDPRQGELEPDAAAGLMDGGLPLPPGPSTGSGRDGGS